MICSRSHSYWIPPSIAFASVRYSGVDLSASKRPRPMSLLNLPLRILRLLTSGIPRRLAVIRLAWIFIVIWCEIGVFYLSVADCHWPTPVRPSRLVLSSSLSLRYIYGQHLSNANVWIGYSRNAPLPHILPCLLSLLRSHASKYTTNTYPINSRPSNTRPQFLPRSKSPTHVPDTVLGGF